MASLRPADARQQLGRRGEEAAERALRAAGMTIRTRRFRSRLGEIDLVAELGELLVFVEVKARSGSGYGAPAEAVTALKRRRLARVAELYLQRHGLAERTCRFDVVEVHAADPLDLRVRHITDAFRL